MYKIAIKLIDFYLKMVTKDMANDVFEASETEKEDIEYFKRYREYLVRWDGLKSLQTHIRTQNAQFWDKPLADFLYVEGRKTLSDKDNAYYSITSFWYFKEVLTLEGVINNKKIFDFAVRLHNTEKGIASDYWEDVNPLRITLNEFTTNVLPRLIRRYRMKCVESDKQEDKK